MAPAPDDASVAAGKTRMTGPIPARLVTPNLPFTDAFLFAGVQAGEPREDDPQREFGERVQAASGSRRVERVGARVAAILGPTAAKQRTEG